ncbi:hypothetical protein [Desulforamulus putei]|uniref:Uncharacterized protein n=1 Tax=Desulforamulus putei DSM 12395 TaxID=1121429 RepID=A0A1M4VIE6_9FIRM|nr:hypothetical protein [Desulforamulus putei]SHE68719.1 hypothetical protein SAMN02745133_00943 [Desulforamulus putei DSM 12395]
MEYQVKALAARMDSLENTMNQVNENAAQLVRMVAKVLEEQNLMKAEMVELKSEMAGMKTEITELKSEMTEINDRLDNMNGKLNFLVSDAEFLSRETFQDKLEINRIKKQIEA